MVDDRQMRLIWTRFKSNLGALWVFADKISIIADDEDRKQISYLAQRMAKLFNENPSEVEKELIQLITIADETEVEPNLLEKPELQEVFNAFQTGDFVESAQKWLKRFPKKRNQLIDLIISFFDPSTANGIILRRSAFVLLVSFFETLIVDLLTLYFTAHSSSPSSERIITRGTFPDRLKLLGTTGVAFGPFDDLKKEVTEIILKRNLFTHHDGIIDQAYLDKTQYKNPHFSVGRRLRISNDFLLNVIEMIYQYSYFIFQECWRSWVKGNYKQADLHYVNTLYSLLSQNHNQLVARLASREHSFKLARRERQTIVINHAIALREMGLVNEAIRLVEAKIPKPATLTVNLALHIIRKENESALVLFARMAKNGKIKGMSADWPLFKPVLTDQRFAPFLERIR